MKPPILYVTTALTISLGQLALAQTDTSQAAKERTAFAMTKATLEFLATDAKTYGYRKSPCEPCATYADLHQFVQRNNLTRANQLIADVQKRAAQASPADLRTYLLKRVTEGADHAHRTKLASFSKYQRTLDAAVGGPSVTGETPTLAAQASQTADADVFDEEPIVGDSTQTDTSAGAAFSRETTSSQPSSNDQSSMLSWLPLVLSLLSLAGVVVLFLRQGQNRPASNTDVNSDLIKELSGRLTKLERTNTNLFNQVALLEKVVNQPRNTPVSQSQSRPAPPAPASRPAPVATPPPITLPTQPVAPDPVVAPASPAPANTPRPSQPAVPTLFYGRTADLGDGFSVSGLSTNPDRDTVFEIRRMDNSRAEFQVSDNPDLQRLALSDPYSYLNDTCTYATQPRPGSRIRTERPGTLSLQGEKWLITEKAQISFTG